MKNRIFGVVYIVATLFTSGLSADDSSAQKHETSAADNNTDSDTPAFSAPSTDLMGSLLWFSSTQDAASIAPPAIQPRIPLSGPDAPTGLSAEVYSSSALELFWDRVPDLVLSYEVRQDTRSIGFTDGTSFFISSGLEPGVEYDFEVIARQDNDPGVLISESAKITVSLNEGGSGPTEPVEPSPVAPANPRLARYSSSTAELFWDRAPVSYGIVLTEIFRDGALLGSTDGTSYLDQTREKGQVYEYALVAVNADGDRSDESILKDDNLHPETNPTPGFVVDENNLNEVLNAFAYVTRAEPVVGFFSVAGALIFGDFDELLLSEPGEPLNSSGVTVENFSCKNEGSSDSGSLVRTIVDRENESTITVDMENCEILGTAISGSASVDTDSAFVLSATDLTLSNADNGSVLMSGTYTDTETAEPGTRILDASYSETDADGAMILELDYYGVDTGVGLDVIWRARDSSVEGVVFSASSDISFERQSLNEDFTVGTLNVSIDTGLSVVVNADNGDAASFSVIVDDGEVASAYSVNWTTDNRYFLSD